MADEKRNDMPHNIIVEGRERLSVSGVLDVENFDENAVNLSTTRGILGIRGEGLHIEKLSLETGELSVGGRICGLNYSEQAENGGFFARLFG